MSPLRKINKKIGELLIEKGLITMDQLEKALSLQVTTEKDKRLGQILFELGYVNKDDIYLAEAVQQGCPYINITRCIIEPEVISIIPQSFAKKYGVFPVDRMGDILTIAMVRPLDKEIIELLTKLTKSAIKIFTTTPSELQDAITKYYTEAEKK